MADRKVLVFTEFADTARYLRRELEKAGISGVAQLDSSTKVDRADGDPPVLAVLQRPQLGGARGQRPGGDAVLIATDVLSEGLNLQDATG
jgi:ERCC4-related helicase